jgi:hypothetical protein
MTLLPVCTAVAHCWVKDPLESGSVVERSVGHEKQAVMGHTGSS